MFSIPSRIQSPGGSRPTGFDVQRWPEYIALVKRLGLSMTLPYTDVIIELPMDGAVRIIQTYLADDIDQKDAETPFDEGLK